MKLKSLMIVLAMTMLVLPGALNAATVDLTGQSTALPGESFFVDVLLTGGINNSSLQIQYYSFILGIFGPSADAGIEDSGEDPNNFYAINDYTTGQPNYLFSGNLGPFDFYTPTTVGDLIFDPINLAIPYDTPGTYNPHVTVNAEANTPVVASAFDPATDYLLARVMIEVDPLAAAGQTFNFGWVPGLDGANEIGNLFSKESLEYGSTYSFQVVPIPGAVWLLGAGLLGLIGLRRKSS